MILNVAAEPFRVIATKRTVVMNVYYLTASSLDSQFFIVFSLINDIVFVFIFCHSFVHLWMSHVYARCTYFIWFFFSSYFFKCQLVISFDSQTYTHIHTWAILPDLRNFRFEANEEKADFWNDHFQSLSKLDASTTIVFLSSSHSIYFLSLNLSHSKWTCFSMIK